MWAFYSVQGTNVQQKSSASVKEEEEEEDDEEDIDLFGSDEDEEAENLREQRLKEYAERKAKKPAVIAKSSILLDVKPVSLKFSVFNKKRVNTLLFKTDWLTCCSPALYYFAVGWWNWYGEAGGVCAICADWWPAMGHVQTGSCGLWHQKAPDCMCGGG